MNQLELARFRRALLVNRLPGALGNRRVYRALRAPVLGGRAKNLIFALNYIRAGIAGGRTCLEQIAEFGVAAGEGFRQLNLLVRHYAALHTLAVPRMWAFDSFQGMPPTDDPADAGTWSTGDYPGDEANLRQFLKDAGWEAECTVVPGLFAESIPPLVGELSPDLLLVDCDYYTSTLQVFTALKDALPTGAVVYFDDLNTNFGNRNLGEERLIHEVNQGVLGKPYHLHHLWDRTYVWSNAERPVRKVSADVLEIPLKPTARLGDLY